jgi:hypothetical protein
MSTKRKGTSPKTNHSSNLYYEILRNQLVLQLLTMNTGEREKKRFLNSSVFFIGLASLAWFLFRTGTRPTRVTYPCQRAALSTFSISVQAILPATITTLFVGLSFKSLKITLHRITAGFKRYWKSVILLIIILPTAGLGITLLWGTLHPAPSDNNIELILTPHVATSSPASDIYVLKGPIYTHIPNLINLMGSQGLNFYQSNTPGTNQGPSGLITNNDVVLIKINSQWAERGGTNTDLLRELIQAILDHPEGFEGEIVIADNGQGVGSLSWSENNADNPSQSVANVVTSFSSDYKVNMYDWQLIRGIEVEEYSDGDLNDGYIRYNLPDPDTGIYVTYPKFQTTDDTYISFKHGVWNGTTYENRLKVINFPILKSHSHYGVTGASKHYMGVQSEGQANPGGLGNGHYSIAEGGMGTLLAETRYPILNILDAIYVNAHPWPSYHCGPSTAYEEATHVNVLMASTDPIALDYWAAKHVLMQTAALIGYDDTHTLDPDNYTRGTQTEALGIWLRLTETELIQNGYAVTCNESHMNVYISQAFSLPIDLLSLQMIIYKEASCTEEMKSIQIS